MYKLVQWAYQIGQYQERQRIKNAINECRRELANEYSRHDFEIRDLTDEGKSAEDIAKIMESYKE